MTTFSSTVLTFLTEINQIESTDDSDAATASIAMIEPSMIKSWTSSSSSFSQGRLLFDLRFAGMIPIDELSLMQDAIEQDCGKVDLDEW